MSPTHSLVLLFALLFLTPTSLADEHPKRPIIGKPKPPHGPPSVKPPSHGGKPPHNTEELSTWLEQENWGDDLTSHKPPKKPPPKHVSTTTVQTELPVAAKPDSKPPVHKPPKGKKPPPKHYPGWPQVEEEEVKEEADKYEPKKPPVQPYKPTYKPPHKPPTEN